MFRGGKQEAMTDEAGVTEEGNSQLWADVGVIGGDAELDNSEVSVNQWTAVIAEKGSTLSQSARLETRIRPEISLQHVKRSIRTMCTTTSSIITRTLRRLHRCITLAMEGTSLLPKCYCGAVPIRIC
jgi:hypothetical protein